MGVGYDFVVDNSVNILIFIVDIVGVWSGILMVGVENGDIIFCICRVGILIEVVRVKVNGYILIIDEVYDVINWNGNIEVLIKNVVRDKIELLGSGIILINSMIGFVIII